MNTSRANPFADIENLPKFNPKPTGAKPVTNDQIEKIADANGFPSRQAARAGARKNGSSVQNGSQSANQHQGNVASDRAVVQDGGCQANTVGRAARAGVRSARKRSANRLTVWGSA